MSVNWFNQSDVVVQTTYVSTNSFKLLRKKSWKTSYLGTL